MFLNGVSLLRVPLTMASVDQIKELLQTLETRDGWKSNLVHHRNSIYPELSPRVKELNPNKHFPLMLMSMRTDVVSWAEFQTGIQETWVQILVSSPGKAQGWQGQTSPLTNKPYKPLRESP